jgi:hypothetical protein
MLPQQLSERKQGFDFKQVFNAKLASIGKLPKRNMVSLVKPISSIRVPRSTHSIMLPRPGLWFGQHPKAL